MSLINPMIKGKVIMQVSVRQLFVGIMPIALAADDGLS